MIRLIRYGYFVGGYTGTTTKKHIVLRSIIQVCTEDTHVRAYCTYLVRSSTNSVDIRIFDLWIIIIDISVEPLIINIHYFSTRAS